MFNPHHEIMVNVSGGTLEENQQICTAIRCALRGSGFSRVDIDPYVSWDQGVNTDRGLLAAVHAVNPELADISIFVTGQCNGDDNHMLALEHLAEIGPF